MKTAETPAGTFTINRSEIPANYICAAEQKIEKISENHITTRLTESLCITGGTLLIIEQTGEKSRIT